MTPLDRRDFLRAAALGGAAATLSPAFQALLARSGALRSAPAWGGAAALAESGPYSGPGDYGPLRPAGPELALSEGFEYRVVSVSGRRMTDGAPTPIAFDGMAAFPGPDGLVRLVRNHEVRDPPGGGRMGWVENAYDRRADGGTTTLDIRVEGGEPALVRDFVSLGGTIVNCAGGPTPWGSWLTCEEATWGRRAGFLRPHGYVFEVPADADGPVEAMPLKAMGRFEHEAVAVDPWTGIVYLTEDFAPCGFYRYIPDRPGELSAGGRLQMLALAGERNRDTRRGERVGRVGEVRWVDIHDPDPPHAGSDPLAVLRQGWRQGAALFSRLEGCGWGDDGVWFHATDGGDASCGQVWLYRPDEDAGRDPAGGGTLELVFESPGRSVLNKPDNLVVSPRGGIVICEDCAGAVHIRGLTPDGRAFDFARNLVNDREFAGACFDPSGRVLFVNIQGDTVSGLEPPEPSRTLAIWGPWETGAL